MESKGKSPIFTYSTCISAAILVIAAVILLCFGLQPLAQDNTRTGASLAVTDQYRKDMQNEFTKIIFGDVEIEKEYAIAESAIAAPVPDPTRYGEAESPAELQWLIDEAEKVLQGQKLYFSTDMEIMKGSKVHYYLDDTILAITWKQVYERVVFTYSEVKILHPSQFRRYLSGGSFGSGQLSLTTEMSQSVNAVVACSADFYSYRRQGITATNGLVHKYVKGVKDLCFITYDGDMILERGLEFGSQEEAQAYLDENNVNFSLAFGPMLVQNYENVCPKNYNLGEVKEEFPRAAICQMDKLHYMFVASNMEKPYYRSLNMQRFADYIHETGCLHAYALDGGQTASVAMNNNLINQVNYGSQRLISDIIYFATAKPAGE